jgi:hypothetical protein
LERPEITKGIKSAVSKIGTIATLVTLGAMTSEAGNISGKVTGEKAILWSGWRQSPERIFPSRTSRSLWTRNNFCFNRTLWLRWGRRWKFRDSDNVQHNIFWPSISGNTKLMHNMGTWPQGEKRDFEFDTPGVVPLLCDVHPELSGHIIVIPTPYFAETDDFGNFKIANVPDGSYTVTAWHEGYKNQSKPVTVVGDVTTDFALNK